MEYHTERLILRPWQECDRPSQRVMEKIGMMRCEEFDHPLVPQNPGA